MRDWLQALVDAGEWNKQCPCCPDLPDDVAEHARARRPSKDSQADHRRIEEPFLATEDSIQSPVPGRGLSPKRFHHARRRIPLTERDQRELVTRLEGAPRRPVRGGSGLAWFTEAGSSSSTS